MRSRTHSAINQDLCGTPVEIDKTYGLIRLDASASTIMDNRGLNPLSNQPKSNISPEPIFRGQVIGIAIHPPLWILTLDTIASDRGGIDIVSC